MSHSLTLVRVAITCEASLQGENESPAGGKDRVTPIEFGNAGHSVKITQDV